MDEATIEGAVLRLRPIMMTALVATLDCCRRRCPTTWVRPQRPFALVIVGGLLTNLAISVLLLPTLYTVLAGRGDLAVPLAIAEEASPGPSGWWRFAS